MVFEKKKLDADLPPLPPTNFDSAYSKNMPSMSEQMQNIQKSQLTPARPQQSVAPNPFQQPMQQTPQSVPLQAPLPSAPTAIQQPLIAPPKPKDYDEEQEDEIELFTEDLEKIANSIIEDKMKEIKKEVKELEKIRSDIIEKISGLSSQVAAVNERINNIESAVLTKVREYNKNIKNVNSELEAVGKVFEKLIPEFTSDLKDFKEIIKKTKKEKVTKEQIFKKKQVNTYNPEKELIQRLEKKTDVFNVLDFSKPTKNQAEFRKELLLARGIGPKTADEILRFYKTKKELNNARKRFC